MPSPQRVTGPEDDATAEDEPPIWLELDTPEDTGAEVPALDALLAPRELLTPTELLTACELLTPCALLTPCELLPPCELASLELLALLPPSDADASCGPQ